MSLGSLTACGNMLQGGKTQSQTPAPKVDMNDSFDPSVLDSALAPAKGLQLTGLFSQKLDNQDDRIERIEVAVQRIRDDFDEVQPAFKRLSAIEGEIGDLVVQLKTLIDEPDPIDPNEQDDTAPEVVAAPQNAAPAAAPVVASTKPPDIPKASSPPAFAAGDKSIHKIRVVEHQGKTRIVLDSPHKNNYTLDYDPDENLVILSTSASRVKTPVQKIVQGSSAIKDAEILEQGGAVNLVLSLSKGSSISKGQRIKPSAANPYHRYYFDILY